MAAAQSSKLKDAEYRSDATLRHTDTEPDEFFRENSLPWSALILFYTLSAYICRYGPYAIRWLQRGPVPRHVALIMDGNRRYARAQHFDSVLKGHARGFEQLTKVCFSQER